MTLEFLTILFLSVPLSGTPNNGYDIHSILTDGRVNGVYVADPCALLSNELLQRHFTIGNAEVTRSPSKYSPHPLCIATWPKPDAEAIEAENEANMMAYMTAKMQGNDEEASKLRKRSTNEVSLTINKDTYETAEKASAGFDNAMRILREGMTVTVRGKETKSPTYETTPVEGVGEKAMWVSRMNQLSVLSGKKIFHLGVLVGNDPQANLAHAREVAKDLCASIH